MPRPPFIDRVLTLPGGARLLLDVLAVILLVGVFWVPPTVDAPDSSRFAAGWTLTVIAATAMLLRRRLPAASTVAAGSATVAGYLLGVCEDPMLATAWCLYPLAVARASRTRELVLIFAGLLAGLATVTGIPAGDASGLGQRLVLAVAALSVSWLLGTAVGRQIATAREAERARVQLEVARDVHDVVGHALGVISAEAGVTRGLADAGEQELRDSLSDIEVHARKALEEMQVLVRGLRAASAIDAGSMTASASAARLSPLVETTRAAGIGVDARILVNGYVDDAVGATVFRIVQESLSNVVRHAPGAACTVDVHEEGDAIVVRIRDHGPGARANERSGTGLSGMRERALLVGGTVNWGNHPEGGFEVNARLPVRTRR